MMDLNLWTEDFLPQDLGLDLLADQQDGQYDDLKDQARLISDYKHNQLEDVVEPLSALSQSSLDDIDMSWMESDVGSLIDALASQQQLSFTPELFDMTSSLPTDNVSHTVFNIFNTGVCLPVTDDSNLTPPDSPEQVLPEILLDQGHKSDDISLSSSSISHFLLPGGSELFKNELNTDCSEPQKTELHTVQDTVDFLDSPLSVEVESMLSSPESSSPQSPNSSALSLILSSPELYKVIAAPSNVSNRYSPYSKQKDAQKAKSTKSRTRKLKTELEPDTLFLSEDAPNLNKKDRKRLQNKNAAIRYRLKKKDEADTVHTEVEGLEDRNQELKTTVEDLERQISCIKNLMQAIRKAKGVSL